MTSKPLGEIADIVRGISFPKDAKSLSPREGHVACLRTTNVQRDVEWDDLWFVPAEHVKRPEQFVQPGDILISTANSYELVGKVAPVNTVPTKATLGAFISLIRPLAGVDPKFLFHQLAWGRTQSRIRETASTTTNISNVSTKKLAALELDVPPVNEQRRIVAEIEKQFSRLDEAIANLQRVKANLKRYKAAVLKAAVEGRLVPSEAEIARHEGRGYENGDELLQRVLAQRQALRVSAARRRPSADPDTSNMPPAPEGWVYCAVSQVCDVASGNTPAGVLDAVRPSGDLPWFKVGDMNHEDNQQVMHHADSWLSEADAQALGLRLFPPRTLLFPKRGGAIATNKKRVLEKPACADLNVMGITPCEVVDAFFRVWFASVDLGKLSDGSNVPQINHKDIDPLPLPLPPRAEQERIVAEVDRRLSIVREVEAEVDANLKRAQALRQAVLAGAFAPLSVSHPNPDAGN